MTAAFDPTFRVYGMIPAVSSTSKRLGYIDLGPAARAAGVPDPAAPASGDIPPDLAPDPTLTPEKANRLMAQACLEALAHPSADPVVNANTRATCDAFRKEHPEAFVGLTPTATRTLARTPPSTNVPPRTKGAVPEDASPMPVGLYLVGAYLLGYALFGSDRGTPGYRAPPAGMRASEDTWRGAQHDADVAFNNADSSRARALQAHGQGMGRAGRVPSMENLQRQGYTWREARVAHTAARLSALEHGHR